MEKYEPASVKHSYNHLQHHNFPSPTSQNSRIHATTPHTFDKCKEIESKKNRSSRSPIHAGEIDIQSEYAYAYYEPGAPMRHRNIPSNTFYEEAGPSCTLSARAKPSTSIRAILSTARRNALQRKNMSMSADQFPSDNNYSADKRTIASTSGLTQSIKPHQCQQRSQIVKTQENLYEEIKEAEKTKTILNSESIISFNQYLVEEEFRKVQYRHRRVLDELNLDVEEMLMPNLNRDSPSPTPQPAFVQTSPMSEPSIQTDSIDFLGHNEDIDCLNGAGNYSIGNVDLDSGFSGSNSSYIGSLRYQKSTTPAIGYTIKSKTPMKISNNHQRADSTSSSFFGSSMISAADEIAMISLSSRSSSSNLYDSSKMMNKLKALSISPSRNLATLQQFTPCSYSNIKKSNIKISSLWKGKNWKNKLPVFSSTSSIGAGKNSISFVGSFSINFNN